MSLLNEVLIWVDLLEGKEFYKETFFVIRDWRVKILARIPSVLPVSWFSSQGWAPWQNLKGPWGIWNAHCISLWLGPQVTQSRKELKLFHTSAGNRAGLGYSKFWFDNPGRTQCLGRYGRLKVTVVSSACLPLRSVVYVYSLKTRQTLAALSKWI